MLKKTFLVLVTLMILPLVKPKFVTAGPSVAESSATLKSTESKDSDWRVTTLRRFLAQYDSPLVDHVDFLVTYADIYNLDWRLIPAITGVESTYGKRIPKDSFNAYGWANGKYAFDSWESSIATVSQTLREKYYDKGAIDINQIARRYAPPSTTWAGKVKSIMKKIDRLPLSFTLEV